MTLRTKLMLLAPFGFMVLGTGISGCGGGTSAQSDDPFPDPSGDTPPPSSTGAVQQSGDRTVTASVGRAGGSLSLTNGGRIEFAAGALSENVDVHFSVATATQAFNNRDYEKPVGPTLHIQPALAVSGTVAVSIPAAPIPSGFTEDELSLAIEVPAASQRSDAMGSTQTTWTYVRARSESGRFIADLEAVPGMRVQFIVSDDDEQ